jgi:hypothetical protein
MAYLLQRLARRSSSCSASRSGVHPHPAERRPCCAVLAGGRDRGPDLALRERLGLDEPTTRAVLELPVAHGPRRLRDVAVAPQPGARARARAPACHHRADPRRARLRRGDRGARRHLVCSLAQRDVRFARARVALLGLSIPNFWLGIMLILVFSVKLRWLPSFGRGDAPTHLILPGIALGSAAAGTIMRLVRSNVLETLHLDYVRTARAKGLPERVFLTKHVLRNSAIPALTFTGLQLGYLLSGSIVTETVFALPGRRPPRRASHQQPRLRGRAGIRRLLGHHLRPRQPGGGHALHTPRPPDPVLMRDVRGRWGAPRSRFG